MSESENPALRELAERVGILPEYIDQTGNVKRTADDTRRALLAALGIDASSDVLARESLEAMRSQERREILAPVWVAEVGSLESRVVELGAPAVSHRTTWRLEITRENDERTSAEGEWGAHEQARLTLPDLSIGYHAARLLVSEGGVEREVEQSLIIVPPRCATPDDVLGDASAFGITANLYTLRSRTNWGIGDFTDLSTLAQWGGTRGADFVGVNPLHALLNRGHDISPYSPVSRLFRNPLYVDVSRVPELEHAPEVRGRLDSAEFQAELEALRESDNVRYDQVAAVKGLAFDALFRVFAERVQGSGDARARAYEAFLESAGPALTRFALWMAIAEREGSNWRDWPMELRDPESAAVSRFAELNAARVEFHRWLQFEADRQIGAAADAARDAGMRIGLYQDLAIGSSPTGADTWAFPDLFVRGASVGAPPDPLAVSGQNWGLPPIDPRVLRRTGYRYFIDVIRNSFRHAGALRIDHVMGLFRLFWIPEGKSGEHGAYVRYPSKDLLGILALESVRSGALVVGEDLGTVPHEVPPTLEKWGVLSSKVFYFEREHGAAFKPSSSYPRLALATANTHDLPPIAGYWTGRDIDVRESLGLIDDAAAQREQRDADRVALIDRLAEEKILSKPAAPASGAELRGAIHGFLCRTPSRLVGLSLDDIAGEVEAVNLPGVGADQYSSWTRKMRDPLETIITRPDTETAMRCDGRRGIRDG